MVPPLTLSGPPVTFSDPTIVVFESTDAPPTLSVPDSVSLVPVRVVKVEVPPDTFNPPVNVVAPPTRSVPVIVSSDACKPESRVNPETLNPPETVVLESRVEPPTFKLLPMPTPPFTRSAPVSVLVDCERPFTRSLLFIETSPPSSIDITKLLSS